jgi:hypothetical protein
MTERNFNVPIFWRGSVSDLATDIRGELLPSEIEQLCKLLGADPDALTRIADQLEALREKSDKAEADAAAVLDELGAARRLSTTLVVRVCNALSHGDVHDGDEVEDSVRRVREERDALRLRVDCGHAADPSLRCCKCTACCLQLVTAYLVERDTARNQAYAARQAADRRELTLHGVAAAVGQLAGQQDSAFWLKVLDNLLLDRLPSGWRPITSVSDYASLATALGAAVEALRLSNTCAACDALLLSSFELHEPPHCEDCHPDEDQEQVWIDRMSRAMQLLRKDDGR